MDLVKLTLTLTKQKETKSNEGKFCWNWSR